MNDRIHIIDVWEEECFNHLRDLHRKFGFRFGRKTKTDPDTGVIIKGNEELNAALRKDFSQVSDDIRKELTVYAVNLSRRMLSPRPRKVIECKGIVCPPHLKDGYDALKKEIKEGSLLYPRLSRRILEIDYADGMFNDWGIVHSHLGTKRDRRRKALIEGDGNVAYAFLTDDKAYIIAIESHEHEKWTDERFLNTLIEQFPEVLQPWACDVSAANVASISPSARAELREANINLFTKINATTFMSPFGGTTMNGVRVDAMLLRNRIYHRLLKIESFIEENDSAIRKQLLQTGIDMSPIYMYKGPRLLAYGVVFVVDIPTHHATMVHDDWGVMLCLDDENRSLDALERHRLGEK